MNPYACRRNFGPLTCDHKIAGRKSVDQNCDGMHMASHDYLLYGPKILPSCILFTQRNLSFLCIEIKKQDSPLKSIKVGTFDV